MGDLGTWVTIGDLVACVEPSRRRQRGRHLRDLLLELHAPDLVALGRVLAVPRAVLVGDALLDLERGPGRGLSLLSLSRQVTPRLVRGDRLPNKKFSYNSTLN